MDIETILIIFIVIAIPLVFWFFKEKPEDKEYRKKLKESLESEFIIDPETGTKITLEEAESGHWIAHNNEFLTTSEQDIEKLFTEEEREAERSLNYLRKEKRYLKYTFTDDEIDLLSSTKTLSKYDEWSYSNSYKIEYCDGFIFHPAVKLSGHKHAYYNDDYHESQIMFWVRLEKDFGHYYLREKMGSEKFFDLIKNDDDLKLNNYESFTFKKSENMIPLIKILENFKGQEELEIEFYKNNLFIKNLKFINLGDLLRMEHIAQSL